MGVALRDTTGDEGADALVGDIIGRLGAALPGRVRAVYVAGSRADGTSVATSDLDLDIIFAGAFADGAERARAARIAGECARAGAIELDAWFADEATLARGAPPALLLGSRLVWGEDLRDRLVPAPIVDWARERTHAAYRLIVGVFARPRPVTFPLDFPDPADEFRGYCRRVVRLPDGRVTPSTRDLVRVTGWAATARIALEASAYVARKRDCPRLYAALIGGEWAGFLTEINAACRGEWGYRVPDDSAGRARLRAICARTLAYENAFMRRYRRYLLAELLGDNGAGRALALRVLAETPLDDAEIAAAVARVRATQGRG